MYNIYIFWGWDPLLYGHKWNAILYIIMHGIQWTNCEAQHAWFPGVEKYLNDFKKMTCTSALSSLVGTSKTYGIML